MKHRLQSLLVLASLGAVLAACGGSSYAPEPAPPAAPAPPPTASPGLPASALASVEGLVQFLRSLMPTETGEPLRLEGAVLPVSDTAEPVNLGGA